MVKPLAGKWLAWIGPSCAAKLEKSISSLTEAETAKVMFATEKLDRKYAAISASDSRTTKKTH